MTCSPTQLTHIIAIVIITVIITAIIIIIIIILPVQRVTNG